MKRVINELTADEVVRGSGVKVGDFGTGGRTYVKRYERNVGNGDNTTAKKICFFASILIALGFLVWAETTLASTTEMLEEAARRAITVSGPSDVDASMNGKLVFIPVHNTPKIAGATPQDDFFGLTFAEDVATAHRVAEYCQWDERVYTREVKEGVNPDTGKERIRHEKEYVYVKGWTSHLVSSAFFDNPVAYHNPSRDPAPSRTFHSSGGVDLNADTPGKPLIISAIDFEHALLPAETVVLYKEGVRKLSQQALQSGFNEADHKYVYSRVPEDGFMGSPIVKAAAAYLIDGVVDVNEIARGTGFEGLLAGAGLDWITKGSCKAGDIRVHFETRRLPPTASVLGMVTANGRKVAAFTYSNGYSKVFASGGVASDLAGFAKAMDKETRQWAWMVRAAVAVALLIGSWVGSDMYASSSGTLLLWAGLSAALLGGVWTFIYGVSANTNYIPVGVLAFGLAVSGYVFTRGTKKKGNDNNAYDNRTGEAQKS